MSHKSNKERKEQKTEKRLGSLQELAGTVIEGDTTGKAEPAEKPHMKETDVGVYIDVGKKNVPEKKPKKENPKPKIAGTDIIDQDSEPFDPNSFINDILKKAGE